MTSKTKIDKAGRVLSDQNRPYDEESLEFDIVFEEFRGDHLEPLTRLTLLLQNRLETFGHPYYVAQRLKRKPQILRKLRRFSVRLTQLQDIGGCRIVVDKNEDVDTLIGLVHDSIGSDPDYKILRETDYRDWGRDDSGYRAYHMVFELPPEIRTLT
ncbi:MAG: RelA/SpoT domain-containing protein [Pseudomonadota bacterium]|nr:RelA/SpoT domain-containing protein [Pseudomonadota bacterium]